MGARESSRLLSVRVSLQFIARWGDTKRTLGTLYMSGKLGDILSPCANKRFGEIDEAQCHFRGHGDGGASDSGFHRGGC